jgi:hypothetical protein
MPPSLSPSPVAADAALAELKTRARLLLKAAERADAAPLAAARELARRQRWPWPDGLQLKHTLNLVSAEAGFQHWDHARRELAGTWADGDDHGTLWHDPGCDALLNHWFARLDEARAALPRHAGHVLLPYRRQFVVVSPAYLDALGVPDDPAWAHAGPDLTAARGSAAWAGLCLARLRALRRSLA